MKKTIQNLQLLNSKSSFPPSYAVANFKLCILTVSLIAPVLLLFTSFGKGFAFISQNIRQYIKSLFSLAVKGTCPEKDSDLDQQIIREMHLC